ncbi:MAG: hypothetical protein RR987_11745, partial [Hafnia sp.]
PCPWFDSESGHHYLKKPALGLVFCFLAYGLFIELRSIIRRQRLTLRANGKAVVQTPSALVRVRVSLEYKKTRQWRFFLSKLNRVISHNVY